MPGPGDTGRFAIEHLAVPNLGWKLVIEYFWFNGIAQMPVARPPGSPNDIPCKLVRLHAPYGKKVVSWTAKRFGEMPKMPSPETDDANLTLISVYISPEAPPLDLDAENHEYTVSGSYVYAMLYPPWFMDNLTMGATAYDVTSKDESKINPAQFVKGYF